MTQEQEGPVHEAAAGERPTPPVRRGGILAQWIVLGMLLGMSVGHLLGMALPGDFAYGGAIGLGLGVAVGAAVGTRRADARDRDLVRRADEAGRPTRDT